MAKIFSLRHFPHTIITFGSIDETYEAPDFPGGNVFPATFGAADIDETYEPPYPGGNNFPAVFGGTADIDETYDNGSGFPGT